MITVKEQLHHERSRYFVRGAFRRQCHYLITFLHDNITLLSLRHKGTDLQTSDGKGE